MRNFLVMFAVMFLASWQTMMAANDHFITDAAYRTKMETAFQQKVKLVGKQFYDQKMLKQQNATSDEAEALQFLYAYMPLADVTDYPTSFFLENVRSSFEARQQMAWAARCLSCFSVISYFLFASTMRIWTIPVWFSSRN